MTHIYRSQRDRKIFGLCGGLAEAFNIDATILRLVLVITAFFSAGTVIFLYVVASLVIPKEPVYERYDDRFDSRPGGRYDRDHWDRREAGGAAYEQKSRDTIDEMMEDIEKKALQKELEELRAKLKKYEEEKKGDF